MMMRLTIAALLVLALVAGASAQQDTTLRRIPGKTPPHAGAILEEPVYNDLPGSGKKCWIGESMYFTWKFDKKPKLGTAFLKVQLFDKAGKQIKSLDVVGSSDMPSMRGAHDSGDVPFKLNKKGDYLLPVNVVMPGEWEVKLVFLEGKEPVFRGRIAFKV